MIRINLLPVREWRRKEAVRRQISVFFLSLILLATCLLGVGMTTQAKVSNRRQELASLEKKRADLAYVNKKIQTVNKKRKEVEDKFKAIEKLQEGRTLTVKLLDEIVTSLPIDRLWLTELNVQGSSVRLKGIALDNHTVALFMRRLEASSMFASVNLKDTKRKTIDGHALMEFGLQVGVKTAKDNEEKPLKGAKKK